MEANETTGAAYTLRDYEVRMAHQQEYLRLNMQVCKAIGAHDNALQAYYRLKNMKRPPVWLLDALRGIIDRVEGLPPDLAAYRNRFCDSHTAQEAG